MLDEVKAFLVLSSVSVRLWRTMPGPLGAGPETWLLIGLGGLAAAATGITLTSFVRRPEYLDYTGAAPLPPSTERSHFFSSLSPKALVEAAGRYVLHYPSWFLFVCAANRLDIPRRRLQGRVRRQQGHRQLDIHLDRAEHEDAGPHLLGRSRRRLRHDVDERRGAHGESDARGAADAAHRR